MRYGKEENVPLEIVRAVFDPTILGLILALAILLMFGLVILNFDKGKEKSAMAYEAEPSVEYSGDLNHFGVGSPVFINYERGDMHGSVGNNLPGRIVSVGERGCYIQLQRSVPAWYPWERFADGSRLRDATRHLWARP